MEVEVAYPQSAASNGGLVDEPAPAQQQQQHSRSGHTRSSGHGSQQRRPAPSDGSKVLRNDEVYRQLFEAQVQLTDQLAGTRWWRENKPAVKQVKSTRDLSLPVVRNATKRGMLASEQAGWTRAQENDTHIENPVTLRQEVEWLDLVGAESESRNHATEVADLPDHVRPSKLRSDVIDRIKEKRRERHNLTLEEMHQELYQVGVTFEPLVVQRCQRLQATLAELDSEMERRLSPMATSESLMALDQHQLQDLWRRLAEVFEQRRAAIAELDEDLSSLEADRVAEIRRVFRSYSEVLERVSHLAPAELHRIVDDEAVNMNQTLLGNQRSYADLNARLVMAELERERRLRAHWQDKTVEWRAGHVEAAVAEFQRFVQSSEVQSPPSLEDVLRQMRAEQSEINARRLELIEELRGLAPPSASKSGVAAWHQKMQQVCKLLDETNQRFLQQVYEDYERVCQHCLEAMDQLKIGLINDGVSGAEEADAMVKERCLPLISAQQRVFEEKLEALDRLFEANAKRVGVQLKSLYKMAQGAAHLWDRHELALAGLERTLVERLDANREGHNRQNQDREAQLDVVMDKLRQESTEAGLKHQLGRALEMLKAIEATYKKFKDEQLVEVRAYPKLVDEEVDGLEKAVCDYFGVERADKKKVEKKKQKPTLKPAELAKIKAAQEAQLSEEDEWIRTAFREILFTSRGSEFRVLTEAGVHGIPADADGQLPGERKHGYITLLPADDTDRAAEDDENVHSAAIPRRTILEAKILIRQNFLDFVDTWRQEANKRSAGVVQAKSEELEAELRLRLHLHEPRPRRAELDVHNVRAAELVLHSERVTRHTKGVQQTLDAMKAEFTAMNDEHEQLMARFAAKIDSMTDSYTNATKSAKLVTLSSQCTSEVEGLMDNIRTSLRKFRQGLDNKLQMLREANARFIKSFKLFSEGGNFCPEEVDDYRKRLDKMTSRVDTAESSILSELEGMEKKRLDTANAKVKEFEEQFRNHMVDLVFMEKVARWLTNTQVKIKAEVSDCNSQSLKLVETLDGLTKRVDACAHPNLDKETVRPEDLYGGLHDTFDMFNDRSVYLNCIGTQKPPPVVVTVDTAAAATASATGGGSSSAPGAEATAPATSGGGASKQQQLVRLSSTQPTPVSKPGKQPPEDPSVGVIRRILKTQRARVFGAEVVIDADKEDGAGAAAAGAKDKKLTAKKKKQGEAAAMEAPQELTPGAADNAAQSPSLQGHGQTSVTKMDSVNRNSRRGSHTGEQQPSGAGGSSHPPIGRRTSASRKFVAKNQRLDKKYMVFGEAEDPSEAQHILGRVRKICRDALDGMLLAAELYYRQKGSRPVTRPQALHETFDQCSEVIISKLQAYYEQADAYHNSCVIELRGQLERLERLVEQIPRLAFEDLYRQSVQAMRTGLQRLSKEAAPSLEGLERQRRSHEETLSPALGHPERLHLLEEVCQAEQKRHDDLAAALASLRTDKQDLVLREAEAFAQRVSELAELLFIQLDSLLTADEVERGRVPPELLSTAELLRKQRAGEPLHDPSKDQLIPRGKANWPGLPLNEFQPPDQQQSRAIRCATLIVTAKTTMAHNETDKARREFYDAFKAFFQAVMEEIRQANSEAETLEARWFDNWQKSVKRIRELY